MLLIKFRTTFLFLLLTVGIIFQGYDLLRNIWRDMSVIRGTIGQTSTWRSANFYIGNKFANYITFLNNTIPENVPVILPPQDAGIKPISNTPTMQFYLAPRTVINCPTLDSACPAGLAQGGAFLLVTGDYPPEDVINNSDKLIMFDKSLGVYLPEENIPFFNTSKIKGFHNAIDIIGEAIPPIIWLVVLILSGTLFVDLFVPEWILETKIIIGYGLSLITLTLSLCLISLIGLPLTRLSVLGVSIGMFLGSICSHFPRWRKYGFISTQSGWQSVVGWLDLWKTTILILGLLAAMISIGKSFHVTDEIVLWGVKGYGIAYTGTVKNITAWGTNTVFYPLHIPLVITAFKLLFNDLLPSSKMVFSIYYLGLLLFVYRFLIQSNVNRTLAGLATLTLATTPIIFKHAAIGYANLPFSFHLITAVLVTLQNFSTNKQSPNGMLLGGLLFASSAWVRPEGFILALVAIVILLWFALRKSGEGAKYKTISLISPLLVYGIFWVILKANIYPVLANKESLINSAIYQFIQGNIHLGEAMVILRSLITSVFDIHTWGIVGMYFIITAMFYFMQFRHCRKNHFIITIIGFAMVVLILGMYYTASFDTTHSINWWVNTGFDRMMMPGIILLTVGVISMTIDTSVNLME